jgi:DNA invertase Pin-like site-specific DNA recombinase
MGVGDRVIGYVRVSTAEQGTNGAGLDAQRAAIEAECDRRTWQLIRIEEDVLSGRTLRRPGLQRGLEACRSAEADGVVVAKLDRLSRSLVDFAGLLGEAQAGGWNLVALDLGVDLSTPSVVARPPLEQPPKTDRNDSAAELTRPCRRRLA